MAGVAALAFTLFGPSGRPGLAAGTTTPGPSEATAGTAVAETGQTDAVITGSPTAGSVDIGAPTVTSAGTAGAEACTSGSSAEERTVEVSGVGDSIMLSATAALKSVFDGAIAVDAEEGRQFEASIEAVDRLRNEGDLAPVVVVHLGTNGAFSAETLTTLWPRSAGHPGWCSSM